MLEPKLTVAFAKRGEKPALVLSRNDSELFNFIQWDLEELAPLGYLGACAHIGKTVLNMLHQGHPEILESVPALLSSDDPTPDDQVRFLLHSSIQQRTRAYVGAIDALMQHYKGDEISRSHRENWPDMRVRILQRYPDNPAP